MSPDSVPRAWRTTFQSVPCLSPYSAKRGKRKKKGGGGGSHHIRLDSPTRLLPLPASFQISISHLDRRPRVFGQMQYVLLTDFGVVAKDQSALIDGLLSDSDPGEHPKSETQSFRRILSPLELLTFKAASILSTC